MRLDDRIRQSEHLYDVVTLGEIVVDMISTDYVSSLKEATHFQKSFGGSSGNIAVNLSKLNYRTSAIASLGNDDFGLFLLEFLKSSGVNTDYIQLHPVHTSMVFITKSRNTPVFLPVRHADLRLMSDPKQHELIENCAIFHFTAWALSHKEIRKVTMSLLHHAHKHNKLITFDPNYRQTLWEPGHGGAAFINGEVLPYVDIMKPSLSDAEHLWGLRTVGEAESIFNSMKPLVILTLGKEGAIAFDGLETYKTKAYAGRVVDSTGAGDAFWGGLLGGLLQGQTIRTAIRLGGRNAALSLQSAGAVNSPLSLD